MQHLLLQLKLIKDKTQLQRTLIYNEQNVQSKFNLIHGLDITNNLVGPKLFKPSVFIVIEARQIPADDLNIKYNSMYSLFLYRKTP